MTATTGRQPACFWSGLAWARRRSIWADASVRKPAGTEADAARAARPSAPPMTLTEVVSTFRKWPYLPHPSPLYATLAAVAANRMHGDPLWLMLVGALSAGKTEILLAVCRLPYLHLAATRTGAALLSGTPKPDGPLGRRAASCAPVPKKGSLPTAPAG